MTRVAKRISTLLALLVLAWSGTHAFAQTTVEYSAKFACGIATSSTPMVQPGAYSTTINIHNPHGGFSRQTSTSFLKKAVQALPEGETPPPPSNFMQESLNNDYAEEVDCTIIKTLLGIPVTSTAFIEGYVVIIVPPTPIVGTTKYYTNELDVVGIYTNSKGAMEMQPANEHMYAPGTS